jgi:hypothetical protein
MVVTLVIVVLVLISTLYIRGRIFRRQCQAQPAALKAFQDTDAFFRRHLNTKPKPIDPTLIAHVPLSGQ